MCNCECDCNNVEDKSMGDNNIKTEDNELMQELLEEYFPKPEVADRCEIFILHDLETLEEENRRCCSLKNPKLYKGWREYVKNLPDSNKEVVLTPQDKYWRWKMYKKYIPEERTFFRKTMRSGPGVDKNGILPMTAEDARLYRKPHTQSQKANFLRRKKC